MLALGLCLVPAPPHWCDRRKWQQRGDWKNSKAEPRPPQFGPLSGEFGGPDCALIGRRSRRWAGRPRHPTRRCSLPTCAESGRGLTTAKQPRQLLLWLAPLPPPNPRLRACLPPAGSCVGVSNPKRRTRPPGRSWGDGQGRSGPAGGRGSLASPLLASPLRRAPAPALSGSAARCPRETRRERAEPFASPGFEAGVAEIGGTPEPASRASP